MVLGNVGGFLVKTLASHNRCHNRLHNRYRLFESSVPLGIGIIGRKCYRYSYLEACCHFSGYKGLRKVLRAAVVPSRFPWTSQPSVLALSKTTRRNKKDQNSPEVPDSQINNIIMDNELTVGLAEEVASQSTPYCSKQLKDAESQTVNEAIDTTHASVQTSEKISFSVLSIINNDKAVHVYTGLIIVV